MRRRVSGFLFALATIAAPLGAQLARPRTASPDNPKIVVLPFDRDRPDSALSLLIADGARERIRNNHLDQFNPISRQDLCRALTESGFPCDVPLEAPVVRQLVRWINAKVIIEGTMFRRRGDSVLVVGRLSETGGSDPLSATEMVMAARSEAGSRTGGDLVNKLMDAYDTFGKVHDCGRKLEQRDYQGAVSKAQDALHDFPGNAGAYMCWAKVLEAQSASMDTVVAMLKQAYQRDTLNTTIMRRIAAKYQGVNDTTNLLVWLKKVLAVDFRDNELRLNTIRMMAQMGQGRDAIDVANAALREQPANAELLAAKAVAYAAYAAQQRQAADSMAAGPAKDAALHALSPLWDSAGVTMETVADVDSTKVDSLFLTRITNYFRAVPDTVKWARWLGTATARLPSQLDNWYALASLQMVKNDTTGAIATLHGYIGHIPQGSDVSTEQVMRRHYALSRYMLGMLSFTREPDSAVTYADSALRADSTLKGSVAIIYLQTGLRSYRDSAYAVAATRLQRAIDGSANNQRALVPANFFLGLARFRIGGQMDSLVQISKSCDDVHKLIDWWPTVEAALIAGAAQNRDIVNQLLSGTLPAYKQRADAFLHNFHCQ